MLETVETLRFTEEVVSGSSPMKFLCKNFETYWVKYTDSSGGHNELICEVLGSCLAMHFNIPTPEIDYIRIIDGSYNPNEIFRNPNIIGQNGIGFGSRDIKNHDILDRSRSRIRGKMNFKKIVNPLDFVKIGVFDRHVSNIDRHEGNYNLIVEKISENREKIYAIDHALIFGGDQHSESLNPVSETSLGKNILRTDLFNDLKNYLGMEEINRTAEEYFLKIDGVEDVVRSAFETFPQEWRYTSNLEERIVEFLINRARIESIREQFDIFFRLL